MTTSRKSHRYPHSPAFAPSIGARWPSRPGTPPSPPPVATLSSALVALQREAKTLPRDAANAHYLYTSADVITGQARGLLSEHGLAWSRVSTTVRPPALALGPSEAGEYVGDVVIRWTLHHEGGECMEGAGEYPVVVTPERPHDKAVAAAITYGCGQILMGLLCWDRESASAVDRRADGAPRQYEPVCRGRAAPIASACKERAAELAQLRQVAVDEVWSEVLGAEQIGVRRGRVPRPDQLTVTQGKAINGRLKSTLAAERRLRRKSGSARVAS